MQNFGSAAEATATALNSAGSAATENSRYMESLNAKTQQLKATFQDLANNVITNELVSAILSTANAFLELINTPIGAFATQVVLLTGAMGGFSALITAGGFIGKIGTQFVTAFQLLTGAIQSTTVATTALGVASKITFPILGLVATAIAGIIAVAPHLSNWYKELTNDVEYAQEKTEGLNTTLAENKQRLEDLYAVKPEYRTEELWEEIEALEAENAELEKNLAYWEKKESKGILSDIRGQTYVSQSGAGAQAVAGFRAIVTESGKDLKVYGNSIEEVISQLNALGYASDGTVEGLEEIGITIENTNGGLVDSETHFAELIEEYDNLAQEIKQNSTVTDEQYRRFAQLRSELDSYANALRVADESNGDLTTTERAQMNEIAKLVVEYENLIEQTDYADSAMRELAEGANINADQAEELINKYPELESALVDLGDIFSLDTTKLYELADAGEEAARALIQAQLEATEQTISSIESRIKAYELEMEAFKASNPYTFGQGTGLSTLMGTSPEDLRSQRAEYEKYIADTEALAEAEAKLAELREEIAGWDDTDKLGLAGDASSSSSSSATDPLKEQNELFQEQIDILDHELYLMEKQGASQDDLIAKLKEVQEVLHEQANWFRAQGLDDNSEYIRDLQKQWWSYQDEIDSINEAIAEKAKETWEEQLNAQIDALNEQKDAYETAFNYIVKQIEKEIEALEEQRDAEEEYWDEKIAALEEQNDAINEQIELQEKQQAVAEANQRKLFVFKDGRFQYISDLDEVAQATAELEAYEREQALQQEVDNLETLKEQALAAIDAQIAGWEEYKEQWSSVVDNYEEEQDRLIAEQVLGIELEGQNWRTRLDNLAQYVEEYKSLMSQLSSAESELEAGYQGSSGGAYVGGGSVSTSYSQTNPDTFFTSAGFDSYATIPGAFGGNVGINIENGKTTTTGLPIGTIVHTQGGDYQITGGTGEAGNPYQSQKVQGYASGTLSASGGLSLVGENGPELRVLGAGDGIIPSDVTSNLWDWGKLSPGDLISNLGNNIMNIVIENLNLPGVTDGESFVAYLQSNAWSQAVQFASNR